MAGDTLFGRAPGDVLDVGLHGRKRLFLARRETGHRLLPLELSERANV